MTNAIRYQINSYLISKCALSQENSYEFSQLELMDKFKTCKRNVIDALNQAKKRELFTLVHIYKNGKRHHSRAILTPKCINRIEKSKKEYAGTSFVNFGKENTNFLMQRFHGNKTIDTIKSDKEIAYAMYSRMAGNTMCLDLENSFYRFWDRIDTQTLIETLLSFFKAKKWDFSCLIKTLGAIYNGTWTAIQYAEHVVIGLKQWLDNINQSAKQMAFNFMEKVTIQPVQTIAGKSRNIINEAINRRRKRITEQKSTKETMKMISASFECECKAYKSIKKDPQNALDLLGFFQKQGRINKESYPLFLYALKNVHRGRKLQWVDTKTGKEFTLAGTHIWVKYEPNDKARVKRNYNKALRNQYEEEETITQPVSIGNMVKQLFEKLGA